MKYPYFIRVTNIDIFNTLVEATEQRARLDPDPTGAGCAYDAQRKRGYYELNIEQRALWQQIYLYGQMLAQARADDIDGGERRQ